MEITAFHGTATRFTKFDIEKAGNNTNDLSEASTAGFFFTNDYDYASYYAEYADGNIVMKCTIELENPIELTAQEVGNWDGKDLRNCLLEDGFDGAIIHINENLKEYLVLNPEQINIL